VALAAKRHWGYPEEWIVEWTPVLTITAETFANHSVIKLEKMGVIVGFYVLRVDGLVADLEHLWVLPAVMGEGAGRHLFDHAARAALHAGARILRMESDPNAESFYLHMGASRVGQRPAPMGGVERALPLLEMTLS